MENKNLAYMAAIFVVSVVAGFSAGNLTGNGSAPQTFDQDLEFTANSSNPVETASFDGNNISLIVQPGKNASFYMEVNETVNQINGLAHDGDIHELRKMKALNGKTYLLYFRYRDDANVTGDEWITLYRAREL